jgi:hypothetical protein
MLCCSLNIRKALNQFKTKNAIIFIKNRQVKHLQNHKELKNQEIDQSKLLVLTMKEQVQHPEGANGKLQEQIEQLKKENTPRL